MSAENGMMLEMDDINNPVEVDLVPTGNYSVTIKNAVWNDEKSQLNLFCIIDHGLEIETDDLGVFLGWPCEGHTKMEKRKKGKAFKEWLAAIKLDTQDPEEVRNPENWKGRQVNCDIEIWPANGDWPAKNAVKNVNTIA